MNEQGYTLLEVTLFLAISGLLALVAFIGLGPRLRNVRFTEAVRSLESSIQRNLAESNLGSRQMNTRVSCVDHPSNGGLVVPNNPATGTQSGSSEHCVLNGRVAIIGNDRITYREVISRREPVTTTCYNANASNSFNLIAVCHRATVLSNAELAPSVYTYSNGVRVTGGLPPSNAQGYGYLVHPTDGTRVIFRFQRSGSTGHGQLRHVAAANLVAATNSSLDVCYGLGSRRAQITFSNQTLTPKVNFEGC